MNLEATANQIVSNPLFLASNNIMEHVQWEAVAGLINTEQLFMKPTSPDEPFDIAEFEFAGQVAAEAYKLYPCGGYQDGFSKPLSATRASAHIIAPRSDQLQKAWNGVLESVSELQNSRRVTNTQLRNKICETLTSSKMPALRLRHALFRRKEQEEEEEEEQEEENEETEDTSDGKPTAEDLEVLGALKGTWGSRPSSGSYDS